jgi:hypothetical protein
MDNPPEKNEPQGGSEQELNDCHTETALEELPESRDDEAAQRGQHIPARPLPRHFVASTPLRVRSTPTALALNCTKQS